MWPMSTKFTALFGDNGIDVSDMTNKSKGDIAYTMLGCGGTPSEEIIDTPHYHLPGSYPSGL